MPAAGIGSQESIPHQDLAIAFAIISVLMQVGGAIGRVTAGIAFSPRSSTNTLEECTTRPRKEDFGSIIVAKMAEPKGLVVKAYNEAMYVFATISLGVTSLAFIAGSLAQNFILTDAQNVVEVGRADRTESPEVEADRPCISGWMSIDSLGIKQNLGGESIKMREHR
ncbi:hypothetical protein I317_06697 [Kwoniella heveanensis CBS 569]|nr:hypothetical protein I317_06697 [Kwoniella heveanensis CBS 569]